MRQSRKQFIQVLLAGGTMYGGLIPASFAFHNEVPSNMTESLAEIWNISGQVAREFAEAMPEDDYGFRPVEDMYTYGEQMLHIAENNISLISQYISNEPAPSLEEPADQITKTSIIEQIETSIYYGEKAIHAMDSKLFMETVSFFAGPLPRWHVLFVAQDHTTHHCGQAVIYLNIKGIQPPRYRKWR